MRPRYTTYLVPSKLSFSSTDFPKSPFLENFIQLMEKAIEDLPDKIREVFPDTKVWFVQKEFCYKSMLISYNKYDFFMCDIIFCSDHLEYWFSMVEGTVKDNVIHVYRYGSIPPHGAPDNYKSDLQGRSEGANPRMDGEVSVCKQRLLTDQAMYTVITGLLALNVLKERNDYHIATVEPWHHWGTFKDMKEYKNWLFGTETYKIIEGTYENHYRDEIIVNRNDSNTMSIIIEDFIRRKWAIGVFRRYNRNNAAKIIQQWWLEHYYKPNGKKYKCCKEHFTSLIV